MNECKGEKLRYRLNPCDYCRFKVLAPIGGLLAKLWDVFTKGTDCPCCLGTRLVFLIALTSGVTYLLT